MQLQRASSRASRSAALPPSLPSRVPSGAAKRGVVSNATPRTLEFYRAVQEAPAAESPALQQRRKEVQSQGVPVIWPRGSVAALVLGGAETDSRRLFPLTQKRTLPAIPVAGSYRLIDVPLSNCLKSGIDKVYVLTQYNSTSLNRYLQHAYDRGTGFAQADGFIEVVAGSQGPTEQRWAEGPADSVRQWWNMFRGNPSMRDLEDVLVLPSDQIYSMDYASLVDWHRKTYSDLTIVCRPVPEALVSSVGCIKLSDGFKVKKFEEKPQGERKAYMSMDVEECAGFFNEDHLESVPFLDDTSEGSDQTWIGSTGIYLFKKSALEQLLGSNPRARDFSRDLIPDAIRKGMKVTAFHFPEYWVDIGGSVADYYNFNMSLARDELPFSFHSRGTFYYGSDGTLPPNVYEGCSITSSLISSGCRLGRSRISGSVIGSRCIIGDGCEITDSVVMGSDYYESEKEWPRKVGPAYPHIGVGPGCTILRAVVDKNARIGANVQLINKEGVHESMDRIAQGVAIRDGIIVVSKSSVLPDGTVV